MFRLLTTLMVFATMCIVTLSGCFYLQHGALGYRDIRDDTDSNVSLILRHNGETPSTIEFQLVIDGEEACPPTTIRRNSEKVYCADIRLETGTHTLFVKVANTKLQAQKTIEVTEEPMYLWIEYENPGDIGPTLEIRQMEYMPGFA